uniref:Claudin n=1 Tax=Salvator merianae TaxID=96440 RepID=A0A8D0EAL7_SALMN
MASSACHFCAFLLSFLGLILLLITTVSSSWKVSSSATSIITANWIYEGLWMNCVANSLGSMQCKNFSSLLSLATYIQACRALMIVSLILGMCGTLLSLLGLKCTQIGSNNESTKTKISMVGGAIFVLAGLSSMVAISWYAERITAQFFDSFYGGTKYEFGYALYLGWAGSLLSIVGGLLLICSSCTEKQRNYNYDSATNERNKPLIYVKKTETVTTTKDYV